jgi:hypothetical protein
MRIFICRQSRDGSVQAGLEISSWQAFPRLFALAQAQSEGMLRCRIRRDFQNSNFCKFWVIFSFAVRAWQVALCEMSWLQLDRHPAIMRSSKVGRVVARRPFVRIDLWSFYVGS